MSALRLRSRLRLVELLALWVLTTAVAQAAAPVTVGPVVITPPQGFVAAQTQKTKKTLITAWTKSVKDGSSKTFLQITVVEQAKPEEAEKYLRHELAALERRRGNYTHSPVAHIQLAGAPAVRATWNGNIGGYPVMGVLYSVIVKDHFVVKILAQDLGTTPTDGLFEAMQAIESIGIS